MTLDDSKVSAQGLGGFSTPEQIAKAWFSRDPEFKARGRKQLIELLVSERARAIEDAAVTVERISEAMDPTAKCSLRQWNAIKSNNRRIARAIRGMNDRPEERER